MRCLHGLILLQGCRSERVEWERRCFDIDGENRLNKLVSKFGKRKRKVNVGKNKVRRRGASEEQEPLNGEELEGEKEFKYWD